MTYDDLRLLIDYNYWARPGARRLSYDHARAVHTSHGQQVRFGARHRRAYLRRRAQKPDHLPDVDAARKEWAELEGEMREQLARLGPGAVERTIEYQDLRGNDQSDVLWQMLQHVVNHGTYHRGQITTMLRQLGAAPPKSTDLIAFYRERNRED